jgi:hypothetical protein
VYQDYKASANVSPDWNRSRPLKLLNDWSRFESRKKVHTLRIMEFGVQLGPSRRQEEIPVAGGAFGNGAGMVFEIMQ